MLETLKNIDIQLFTFLNEINGSFADFLMYWISHKYTWIPFYVLLLYFIIKNFKRHSIFILLGIFLLIFLSDKLSVFCKEYFERPRPCHEPLLEGIVHTVKGKCGGAFGFVSSHAANSFALATFISLLLKKKMRYMPHILIAWASLVSYSRVYLGVHYPGDVICGALLGFLLGIIIIYFLKKFNLLSNSSLQIKE